MKASSESGLCALTISIGLDGGIDDSDFLVWHANVALLRKVVHPARAPERHNRRMRFPKPPPSPVKPAVRAPRLKTYSAQSGFVYQYMLAAEEHAGGARRYRFDLSANRGYHSFLTMELGDDVIQRWQQTRRRELSPTECYAMAKMKFFETLDSSELALAGNATVSISEVDMDSIAATLELI